MSFREFFVNVPVVGGLAYCRWGDLWRTLEEIFIKFVIAALPIIFSSLFLRYGGQQHFFFPVNITKNLENGELYLYCTSMLSSILYIAIKERGNEKPGFPNRVAHLLLVIVMIALFSFVFTLKRAGVGLDPILLVDMSYWFFLFAFIMVILATTINNGLNSPNPITFQQRETDNFLDKFNKHRGKA